MLVEKLGGRKAAACVTGLVVVVGVYLYKGNISNELMEMIKYLVGTYLAGNIAADVVDGVNAKINTPPPSPPVDLSGLTSRVDAISQAVSVQDQTLQQVIAAISQK